MIESQMKVFLMQGTPGSGKTTLAKELETAHRAVVLSTDEYFTENGEYRFDPTKLSAAHCNCLGRFVHAMQNGTSVIVDNCNESAVELAPYVSLALAYGAERVELVVVSCNPTAAWVRNTHGVPMGTVHRVWKSVIDSHEKGLPKYWTSDSRIRVHRVNTDASIEDAKRVMMDSLSRARTR